MFNENSFVVSAYTLKLKGIDQSYLNKLLKPDLPVNAMIGRLDFLCFVGLLLFPFSTWPG